MGLGRFLGQLGLDILGEIVPSFKAPNESENENEKRKDQAEGYHSCYNCKYIKKSNESYISSDYWCVYPYTAKELEKDEKDYKYHGKKIYSNISVDEAKKRWYCKGKGERYKFTT